MKRTLLTLIFLCLTTSLYGQSIIIDDNGIVKCEGVPIGTTETISGDTYEVADRELIEERRSEGADLTLLCVSNVTDMSELLSGPFNQPIGNWDVSNVTDMTMMFIGSPFNHPIDNWDVSSVTSMRWMFYESQFSQPIDSWDVSNVTDMRAMFMKSFFNQPVGSWDVSSVTDMSEMFYFTPFNQPIGDWDVSSVTDMRDMFYASPFNQTIGDWDVSSVTDMSSMFISSSFNQPIGDWDVGSVTTMRSMFYASPFDQPIGNWDVSSVTDMNFMFQNTPFHQALENWDVSSVTTMWSMFQNSSFNQTIENWDVASVTDMSSMFRDSAFNQTINQWCVLQFPSEPNNFSSGSPLTEENKPIWGTCPGTPPKPIHISPTNNATEVTLDVEMVWSSDTLSTKYQLQIFEGVDPTVVDTLVADTSYINSNPLSGGTVHNWRVRGINENRIVQGEPLAGEWSEMWSFTTEEAPVEIIILLAPEDGLTVEGLTPTLIWNEEKNSNSYDIQVSIDEFSTTIVNEAVADTTFTSPELDYATSYQWRVRGTNSLGDGEWSQPWSFTTQVEPTGIVTLVSPESGTTVEGLIPVLIWNTEPNSESYDIQVSLDEFSTFIADETITDTTFTTPSLEYSTEYQWRVRGTNAAGDGEWSDAWSFSTEVETSTDGDEIPSHFTLNQNYPNPFNPTTLIEFSIPNSTNVRLEVFNVTGQLVYTLVNETMNVGHHTVRFDGRSLSSGVYIYRLSTSEYTESRLMNLIK